MNMKDYLPRIKLSDAWSSLLDLGGTQRLDTLDFPKIEQKTVGDHFAAVGDHMRLVMETFEHEQTTAKQKAANRQQQGHASAGSRR
ncbi:MULTISPECIES: hypothetical protein [unclassified Rhodanobacter]|uniref:hypothetical protein n=1 Tax=unclassified Rhodanobacter TaxID=2621553 RepID=UPI001BDDE66E|nr:MULTISPECIES: hypothetical protein [unclassified Rhodanobacter]MBT2142716.1 hypothetical protein [Rhodanobacter sp. LX-99]MBT2148211.1 hypothetical protein [Rhodanobacter sp. LX-100]